MKKKTLRSATPKSKAGKHINNTQGATPEKRIPQRALNWSMADRRRFNESAESGRKSARIDASDFRVI